jgi:hypothetical protein
MPEDRISEQVMEYAITLFCILPVVVGIWLVRKLWK